MSKRKRRSPQRHTVHTKSSRYNVSRYQRGANLLSVRDVGESSRGGKMTFVDEKTYYDYAFDTAKIAVSFLPLQRDNQQKMQRILDDAHDARLKRIKLDDKYRGGKMTFVDEQTYYEHAFSSARAGVIDLNMRREINKKDYDFALKMINLAETKRLEKLGYGG